MLRTMIVALALVVLLPVAAAAEVLDATDQGFTTRTVVDAAAAPDRVYEALTAEIALWWDPAHSWSRDGANLYLDAVAGGVFGERLPNGGSVRHMDVLATNPGAMLRLGGGLGPLQSMAVNGALTFELAPSTGGTTLTVTYAVGGYAAAGLAHLAGPVDRVLADQAARLADHVAP